MLSKNHDSILLRPKALAQHVKTLVKDRGRVFRLRELVARPHDFTLHGAQAPGINDDPKKICIAMINSTRLLCRLGSSAFAIAHGPTSDSVLITLQGDGLLQYSTSSKVNLRICRHCGKPKKRLFTQ